MVVGTKSTIFDTELLQLGTGIKTSLPVGLPIKGLATSCFDGVGGLVWPENQRNMLSPGEPVWLDSFWRSRTIPGHHVHYPFSLNKQVWEANPVIPLFLTLEYSGYFFTAGNYTPYEVGTPDLKMQSAPPSELPSTRSWRSIVHDR